MVSITFTCLCLRQAPKKAKDTLRGLSRKQRRRKMAGEADPEAAKQARAVIRAAKAAKKPQRLHVLPDKPDRPAGPAKANKLGKPKAAGGNFVDEMKSRLVVTGGGGKGRSDGDRADRRYSRAGKHPGKSRKAFKSKAKYARKSVESGRRRGLLTGYGLV